MGLQEAGEYEEALTLARRGTERARGVRDACLLGSNLGRLGEAHEALQNLGEARAAYEEAVARGHYEGSAPVSSGQGWRSLPALPATVVALGAAR